MGRYSNIMGTSNSSEEDPKLNNLVAFIRGIVADKVVTDAEFAELDKYRKEENISQEIYEKALEKLNMTVEKMESLREKTNNSEKKVVLNQFIENRTVHIHSDKDKKSDKNKKVKLLKKSDGSIDRRCGAAKLLKEHGVNLSEIEENKNNKNDKKMAKKKISKKRPLKKTENDDDKKENEEPPRKRQKTSSSSSTSTNLVLISSQKINKMNGEELKIKCKEYGLKVSGKKKELQDRLKEFVKEQKKKKKKN